MRNQSDVLAGVALSKRQAFFVCALLFLVWRPGFLNSETLTLTTYYPAPYGGYVSLLSTGNTFLARDTGSLVVGGNGAAGVDKLTVYGSGTAITTVDGAVRTRLFSASSSGTGYVGTSSNNNFTIRTADADRVTVTSAGQVNISNNMWIGGSLLNTCLRMSYALSGSAAVCSGSFPYVVGTFPNSNGSIWQCNTAANTCQSFDRDYSGYMVCCRMSI